MDIIKEYEKFCKEQNISFSIEDKVNPYDESTLFCPAGMQKYKSQFKDVNIKGTVANVQACIRTNDFDEIGDLSHLLYFNMIGLFSFREMKIEEAIMFWVTFLSRLGIVPDYVTIHSAKSEWAEIYHSLGIKDVRINDTDCIWTDGEIGGYCTEFFVNDIEIGNIVNPLDNCIDVGFGLERLDMIVNGTTINKIETLYSTATKIIESGYKPSNLKQGYILRKVLREIYKSGYTFEHEFFQQEIDRQNKIKGKYIRLKDKHLDKSKEWWYETYGIDLNEIED